MTQGTGSSRLDLEVLFRNAIVEESDWDWDCHSQGMALSPQHTLLGSPSLLPLKLLLKSNRLRLK